MKLKITKKERAILLFRSDKLVNLNKNYGFADALIDETIKLIESKKK